jgi:uncharacterized protein (TIGR00290 family)
VSPPARRTTSRPRVRRPAVLSWSTGKDSAYTLHRVRQEEEFDVIALLTTVEQGSGRVATHRIREELLTAQATSVGIELNRVFLPASPSNATYERAVGRALSAYRARGVRHVLFGDLFLEEIRRYRERQLDALGMQAVFPLWGEETAGLARAMIRSGLKACVAGVDLRRLDRRCAGRAFDADFLEALPPTVDPCGENGEFHTFVTAGPMLHDPVPVIVGAVRSKDGFARADLRLAPPSRLAGSEPSPLSGARDKA